jgi:hypothetical protein
MAKDEPYRGRCFCGAVEIEVSGEPKAMGYCHCASCRSWSAGPVNAFTLWAPEAVKVTKGSDAVARYHKSDNSHRAWCERCGGHLFTEHPQWNLTDIYAATLPTLQFKPALHVNYEQTVLPLRDGLPKMKDFPKELGGSGAVLSE